MGDSSDREFKSYCLHGVPLYFTAEILFLPLSSVTSPGGGREWERITGCTKSTKHQQTHKIPLSFSQFFTYESSAESHYEDFLIPEVNAHQTHARLKSQILHSLGCCGKKKGTTHVPQRARWGGECTEKNAAVTQSLQAASATVCALLSTSTWPQFLSQMDISPSEHLSSQYSPEQASWCPKGVTLYCCFRIKFN